MEKERNVERERDAFNGSSHSRTTRGQGVVPPGMKPQAGAIGVGGTKKGDRGQGCLREAASSCCFRVILGTSAVVGGRKLLRRLGRDGLVTGPRRGCRRRWWFLDRSGGAVRKKDE